MNGKWSTIKFGKRVTVLIIKANKFNFIFKVIKKRNVT